MRGPDGTEVPNRGVYLEVVERPLRGEVVRRLSRGMDDQIGADLADERGHGLALTDTQVMVREVPRRRQQPIERGPGVACCSEEVCPHVVVDAVHCPAVRVEIRNGLGADEPARTGDKCRLAHVTSLDDRLQKGRKTSGETPCRVRALDPRSSRGTETRRQLGVMQHAFYRVA